MIYITVLSFILIIIAGVYNGWIFRLYFSKKVIHDYEDNKHANKLVHSIGFWLRGGLCLFPILYGVLNGCNWIEILFYTLVLFNASWTLYDIIYNLINGQKIFYYGGDSTSSKIDKIFNNTDEFFKLGLLITTVIICMIFLR